MDLKIKEKPLLHGREHGGVVSRGKEKAVHNLIFSGERIIPTRNIQLYRIRFNNQMENNGGRQERAVLALWRKPVLSKLCFLPHHFLEIGSSFPSSTPPKWKTPPWPLPQLGLAECQGQGVFQRLSLASPEQGLETSVRVSAWLTSKVNQLQDATTSDFYEPCSGFCIAFDLRRDLHTLIRPPAATHSIGT